MTDANIEKIVKIVLDGDDCDESTIESRAALAINNAVVDLHAICGDALTKLMVTLDHDTHQPLSKTVMDIYDTMLEDGINWGRIVAMFAFALEVQKKCKETRDNYIIKGTLINALKTGRAQTWMKNNGDFEGLCQFVTDGRAHQEEKIRDLLKLFLLISISSSIVVAIFSHVGFILLKRFIK